MKTMILTLLLLISINSIAQETKVFSLSPMSKKTEVVNGLVIGIGHLDLKGDQKINGVNIDLMVLSPMVLLMGGGHGVFDKPKNPLPEIKLVTNGLNIGIAGYIGNTVHNGMNISLYNKTEETNGISIIGSANTARSLHGFHIAGLTNNSVNLKGVGISFCNHNDNVSGLQLGIINRSYTVKGLQIGIFNKSDAVSGLQLGLINKNAKRLLPIINW